MKKSKIKLFIKKTYQIFVVNLSKKPKWICKILIHPSVYCSHKSYYPEKLQKSKRRILLDQLGQVMKYGDPNKFYFPYGHDVKTKKDMEEYIHYTPFANLRNRLNNNSQHSSTFILRDKLFFGIFAKSVGIDSGQNIALINHGRIFDLDSKEYIPGDVFWERHEGDYFIKQIDGECGDGIFHVKIYDGSIIYKNNNYGWIEFSNFLGQGRFIVQKTIVQHPVMSSLHPQSINTLRLVTIRNPSTGKIELFPSILRIGTGESNVDNTSQGGIAVGFDLTSGKLKKYGFYKPEFGGRVEEHPDSHIKFSDFTIPYVNEAEEQATLLHTFLSDVHSIGWDIAIGENGPIFVEGNDNWEINGPQICNGPLKRRFIDLCKENYRSGSF